MQFHPDKAGPESSGVFVMLKHAYDTLANEVSRFGYDRFGPEIAEWRNVRTVGDYVRTGTQQLVPWYGGSAVVLVTLSVLGKFEMGRYVSRPSPPLRMRSPNGVLLNSGDSTRSRFCWRLKRR